jgi:hypothetical protein
MSIKLIKKINPEAYGHTHYEYSADKKEIEVYIGGWFLCSVDLKDISKEAAEYLFV